MRSLRKLQFALTLLSLLLLHPSTTPLLPVASDTVLSPASVIGACREGSNWKCAGAPVVRTGGAVDPGVAEVCETCGQYWANVRGLTFCCRCNDKVFAFCWLAVKGELFS